MESPITDIVFVCTTDKVPKGYTAITACPCGHDAQLWEKVIGGESGTRYLCFSKEDQGDDKVVEDMYIPGTSQQYLKKDYKIITDTVEGQEPMYHKQLAVKRVVRAQATKVIVDVIVARSRDNISKLYTKLEKVNGLRIAFRSGKLPTSNVDTKNVESKLGQLSVGGSDVKVQLDKYSPSPTIPSRSRVGSQPTVSPTDLSSYSPSSPTQNQLLQKREDNVVRVITASPVFSPPPPHSAPSPQTTTPEPSTSPPPPMAPPPTAPPPMAPPPTAPPPKASLAEATSPQFPVTFGHEPSDGSVAQQAPSLYPSTTMEPSKQATYPPPPTSTYPPPPQNTSSTPSTYPPPGGGGGYPHSGGPTTYPPTGGPPLARYPTPGGGYGVPSSYPPPSGGPPAYGQGPYPMVPSPRGYYGANMTADYSRAGFQSGQPSYSATPSYGSAPPPNMVGYDTNIGFSFGGGTGGGSGPAPYNPYHHQNQSSSSMPNYPTHQGGYPSTQPPSQNTKNIGFKNL